MYIIGVTGGIGSGKSRILNELKENYGAYVVEADRLAHALMAPGGRLYRDIIQSYGDGILENCEPYAIDRAKLGKIVFNDKKQLEHLDKLTHPAVKEELLRLIDEKKHTCDTKLFVIEAALLIQDGYREICDEIWYVWASEEERIRRLIAGRGYTREKCISVIANQEDDDYYKKYADFTINNQLDYKNSSKQLKVRLNKLNHGGIIL